MILPPRMNSLFFRSYLYIRKTSVKNEKRLKNSTFLYLVGKFKYIAEKCYVSLFRQQTVISD